MWYSMRLELNCFCGFNDFQLVMGLYRGLPLFFFFTLVCFDLFLIFDMFLSLCVCVCWSGFGFHCYFSYVCVCMRLGY